MNFQQKQNKQGAAFVFVLMILLGIGLSLSYFMKGSDNAIRSSKLKSDKELTRLKTMDRVSAIRMWALECVSDIIQLEEGNAEPIDFSDCPGYQAILGESFSTPVCLGQGIPWEPGCTRDSSKMPKRFGVRVNLVNSEKAYAHSIYETFEIYYPSLNQFALLVKGHSGAEINIGAASFDGQTGLYFDPSNPPCDDDVPECPGGTPTDLTDKKITINPLNGDVDFKKMVSTNVPDAETGLVIEDNPPYTANFSEGMHFGAPQPNQSALVASYNELVQIARSTGGITNATGGSGSTGTPAFGFAGSGGGSPMGGGVGVVFGGPGLGIDDLLGGYGVVFDGYIPTSSGTRLNEVIASEAQFSVAGGECKVMIRETWAGVDGTGTPVTTNQTAWMGTVQDGKVYYLRGLSATLTKPSGGLDYFSPVCDHVNASFVAQGDVKFTHSMIRYNASESIPAVAIATADGNKGNYLVMAKNNIVLVSPDSHSTSGALYGDVTSDQSDAKMILQTSLVAVDGNVAVDPFFTTPPTGDAIDYGILEMTGLVLTKDVPQSRLVSPTGDVHGFNTVNMQYPPNLSNYPPLGLNAQIGGAPLVRVMSQVHGSSAIQEALGWAASLD